MDAKFLFETNQIAKNFLNEKKDSLLVIGEADKSKLADGKKLIRNFNKEYKKFLKDMEQKYNVKTYTISEPVATFGASDFGANSIAAGFEFRVVIP